MKTGFLIAALAVASALTSLTVEGIKKLLDEQGKAYKPRWPDERSVSAIRA